MTGRGGFKENMNWTHTHGVRGGVAVSSLDVRRVAAAAAGRGQRRHWAGRVTLWMLRKVVAFRVRLASWTARPGADAPNAATPGAAGGESKAPAPNREGAGVAPSAAPNKTPGAGL
jgi:hypothetical protein